MDWEALLQQSPADFISSLSSWLLPAEALAAPEQPTPPPAAADGGDAPSAQKKATAAEDPPAVAPRAEGQAGSSTPEASQGTKVMSDQEVEGTCRVL